MKNDGELRKKCKSLLYALKILKQIITDSGIITSFAANCAAYIFRRLHPQNIEILPQPHLMKTHRTLLPFLAAALLAAPSVNAAFVIIATDTVDAVGDYTYSGEVSAPATFATGGVGNGAYARFSRNTGSAVDTNVRFTAGFGASITVAAGTYRLAAHSGAVVSGRTPWTTFDVKLMTTAGEAWESLAVDAISKSVVTAYVTPVMDPGNAWSQTEVEYVIPSGHALIGTEFTWGFTGGKPAGAYATAWDLAEVQFEAIPEPSAALLGGVGFLLLLRRRRN